MNEHKFLFFDADKSEDSPIKILVESLRREGHVVEVENDGFEKAQKKATEVGEGKDYDCIFIARDLSGFVSAVKELPSVNLRKPLIDPRFLERTTGNTPDAAEIPEASMPFDDICQAFDNGKKMGDFIYLLLRQQGIPQEKLFLYGVDDTPGIADILTLRGVNFIKQNLFGNDKDGGAQLDINSKYLTVKSICGACEEARVYYRYKHIFEKLTHPKLEPLYQRVDKFISLLAELETGSVLSYDAAAVELRKMTEDIAGVYGQCDAKVRKFLADSIYNKSLPKGCSKVEEAYMELVKKNILHLDGKIDDPQKINDPRQACINNAYKEFTTNNGFKSKKDFYVDYNQKVSRLLLLCFSIGCNDRSTNSFHKYVFSCIDNIYTVTCECSLHSGPHTNFNQPPKLPQDQVAWHTLFNGLFNNMLAVLDYIARFPPK